MRVGKEGKLRVKVAREGGGAAALRSKESFTERPGGSGADPPAEHVLSDEEVAWRLHQELNATSPMLRTRSRKAPEFLAAGQQKSSGGGGSGKQEAADGSQEEGGKLRGGSGKGPSRSVNKGGSQAQPESDSEDDQLDSARPAAAAPRLAKQKPSREDEEEMAEAAGRPEQGPAEAGAAPAKAQPLRQPKAEPAGRAEEVDTPMQDAEPQPVAAMAAAAAAAAADAKPSSSALLGGTSSDEAPRAAPASAGADSSSADEPRATRRRGALAAPAAAPEEREPKQEPDAAAAAGAQEEPAAAAAPAPARKGGKAGRQPKIPKLPMVRQEDGRWYRARLLRDAGDKVSLEFTGFEHQFPPIWLPRDSDRIWRGSYKGKDWKHLGGGAWEPKVKSGGRRGKGGKRKRLEKKGSEDMAHSSGPAHSQDDSQDHSDEGEDFDEAESEKPHGLAAELAGEEELADVKQEAEEGAHAAAGSGDQEMGDAEEEPAARKKARRNASRKRLDPIVREALLAAEQGPLAPDDSDDQPGPSNYQQRGGQAAESTPYGWKGAWKRHRSAAAQAQAAAQQGAEAADGEQQLLLPHHTPNPETPVTRGKRSSLTPGALQPLSPRAAAAAAAAIEAAGAGTPRHRQQQQEQQSGEREAGDGEDEAPLSPRRQRGGLREREHSPSDAPLSPRHRHRGSRSGGADLAAGDGPSSPRHRHKAGGSGREEEGGDSGDGREGGGRGGRRRRQQRVFEQPQGSDSEGPADEGTGSESQEEHLPKARPRRQPRKAAIYKDADFAFGEEAEEAELDAAAAAAAAGVAPASGSQGSDQQPAQPVRRRRKPVVSSPAPTDVGVAVREGRAGRSAALPAPLAALDVLPMPPPTTAAAAAAELGAAAFGTGLEGAVDDEEAAAVAALADLPSPRAVTAQRAQQAQAQLYHRQQQLLAEEAALALEEEDGGEGEDDGDDDYAPPVRRRDGLLGTSVLDQPFRKRSHTLPISLDHVRAGRVHKLHPASAAAPISRHYSLHYTDRQHSSNGWRPGPGHAGGIGGFGQHYSHSNHGHLRLQHRFSRAGSVGAEGEEHGIGGGSGRRRERSPSLGPASGGGGSLDGIAVAQGMFGTILSALKRFNIEDATGGGEDGGLNGFGSSRRVFGGGKGGGELGGGGGNGRAGGRLHLFSSAWSHSKWHSSGEPHPSILTIQPDLFSKACAANGTSAALFSLGIPTSAHPLMHCPASKPPLPLFC